MSRVILYVGVATIAFIVGVAANTSVNTLGGLAVDKIYLDATLDVKTYTILPRAASIALPAFSCGQLVVSVTSDGALKLNNMPTGTLNDTSALSVRLRAIFERRAELHLYVVPSELSSRVPKYPQIEKTVYIKAPRSMSYGEVADLIAVVKAADAEPVGLIAELPKPIP